MLSLSIFYSYPSLPFSSFPNPSFFPSLILLPFSFSYPYHFPPLFSLLLPSPPSSVARPGMLCTDIDRIIRDKRIFFFLFCRAFKFCLSLSLSLSWLLRLLSFYLFSNLEWNFPEFNSNFFRLNFFFYFENADNDDDLCKS